MNREILIYDSEVCAFGIHTDHGGIECAVQTLLPLLRRNPTLAGRVDLVAAGTARMGRAEGRENGVAQSISEQAGLDGVAGLDVRAYCASGNMAVNEAIAALDAGRADVAIAVGVEHLSTTGEKGPLQPEAVGPENAVGFSPPVFYGLCASRYLYEAGAPPEALAEVAVKNRRQARTNPHARFREALTVDDVLASKTIATPLTLLQCCPPADGAGAAILVAADALTREERSDASVRVLGLGTASGSRFDRAPLTTFPEDTASATQAFEEAGVGPSDIDVAEVHDAFTINEVIAVEDLGFRPRGEGWRHALDPRARPVVNPSGGLLSRGHPLGATGLAQFDSVRRRLTESRDARLGLISEAGGLQVLGQVLSTCAVLAAR